MPPKKCCKSCANPENAFVCFKKGLGVGYKLGLDREKFPALSTATLRKLGELASLYKVKNYGLMTKQEIVDILRERGYKAGKGIVN